MRNCDQANEFRKVLAVLSLLLCLTASIVWLKSQKTEGLRFVEKMGPGINLGNSLDVEGLKKHNPDAAVQDYEVYWNNPPITRELLQSVKSSGFGSVRIPVSWEEHLNENGIIDPAWMERVKEVVDMALDEGFYVVLDLHHEPWILPTEEDEAKVTDLLCFVWGQIADTFKTYGNKLLFESMNEPRLTGSSYEWNGGTPEMQEVVNRLNAAFVKTVRESGEKNMTRYLVLPGYGHSNKKQALEAIKLPKDRRLIVSVHAYLPYSFALQESGTSQWNEGIEEDRAPIRDLMSFLGEHFVTKRIPVIITEFGCADKNNPVQRQDWTKYYVHQAGKNEIGLFWWDQGGDMKLFDRKTGTCTQPELVEILTSNTGR